MSQSKPVAVVTGASRGIGLAIAQQLQSVGYFVIGSATSEAGAAKIRGILGEQGDAYPLNLADVDSCEQFVAAVNAVGTPAVLVNNAGITHDNLSMRMKDDEWQSVIDTNLTGTFRLIRSFLKGMMKARYGRIINISSVVAVMGNPGQVNYCASKAGLEGLTRSLAQELGSRNITVNAIAPGFIATDMTNELTDDQKNAMLARIPLQRYGDAADIAHATAYLASAGAGYVTGQILHVNGGLNMG
jgi:3-oxoacyl-[acyl-carrier protein] reductase